MKKYAVLFLGILLSICVTMYYQLNQNIVYITLGVIMAGATVCVIFLFESWSKSSIEEAANTTKNAHGKAKQIIEEAANGIKKQQVEIIRKENLLKEQYQEIQKNIFEWEKKIVKYKEQLNHYEFKLQMHNELLGKLRNVLSNEKRDPTSKVEEAKRRLLDFEA